jgi:outer membrane protein assembly factor BamB
MDSTPLVTDQHVYIAAKISGAFGTSGRLYCLDRDTSKVVWTFDNDGTMKPVFSTPWLADGQIWIGEGYHQDQKCRLYCLDAATGEKIGQFRTKSHTESSPCVANGLVYFGAGDDGLYCINPKKKDDEGRFEAEWNYPHVHVDASPAVAGGRVYCGSGVGDIYRETAIFAVDAATGKEIWKIPTELPVWGSPVIDGDQVFFGIGNGNFIEDADRPAGALWCVDAATGRRRWIYPVANGVLARPAVDRANVYFPSRDGHCYAVDRNDGRLRWKRKFDSPVVTSPALVSCSHCGSSHQLYVAATTGQVSCIDPATGSVIWTYDVARHSGRTPQLFSSPRVLVQRQGSQARPLIYFGSGLGRLADWQAALYCLEDRGGSAPVAHADVK